MKYASMVRATFLSGLLIVLPATSLAQSNPLKGGPAATPLSRLLLQDGTLKGGVQHQGAIDFRGYRIVTAADGSAHFVRHEAADVVGDATAPAGWLPSGGLQNGCNGYVYALARADNGDVFAGGQFTSCGNVDTRNVARFVAATGFWEPLGSSEANGVDYFVAALDYFDGHLYVAGGITRAGTLAANGIARWDGQQWSTLGEGPSNGVSEGDFGFPATAYAITHTDTELLVGGDFLMAGETPVRHVARWTGSGWLPLGGEGDAGGVNGPVYAIAASGSDVFVGGGFVEAGGISAQCVARWNGAAWSSLSIGACPEVSALEIVGPDLFAAGYFSRAGDTVANGVARWDGKDWHGLGAGPANGINGYPRALEWRDGLLIVGGTFSLAGGSSASNIAAWDGSSWSTASVGGDAGLDEPVNALIADNEGFVVGGYFSNAGGVRANGVVRRGIGEWLSMGDSPTAQGINGDVYTLAIAGPRVYVGGRFSVVGAVQANNIAVWEEGVWSPLGNGAENGVDDAVRAIVVSDAGVYAGGDFRHAGTRAAEHVARWDGSAWIALEDAFQNGVSGSVQAIAVDGEDLFVGGSFAGGAGAASQSIARWDGSQWWPLGTGVQGGVSALAVYQGDVHAAGYFLSAGGIPVRHIARWDGSGWSPLGTGPNAGTNERVTALASDGERLYVGGYFTSAGGIEARRVARWDGSVWSALGSGNSNGVSSEVFALVVLDDSLFAAGTFYSAGGREARSVARFAAGRWHPLGGAQGLGVDSFVYALAAGSRQVAVGGLFDSSGGLPSTGFARWFANPDDDTLFLHDFEGGP